MFKARPGYFGTVPIDLAVMQAIKDWIKQKFGSEGS